MPREKDEGGCCPLGNASLRTQKKPAAGATVAGVCCTLTGETPCAHLTPIFALLRVINPPHTFPSQAQTGQATCSGTHSSKCRFPTTPKSRPLPADISPSPDVAGCHNQGCHRIEASTMLNNTQEHPLVKLHRPSGSAQPCSDILLPAEAAAKSVT